MRNVMDGVDLTTKEKIYYKGHAKATYLSDGRNVEDALAEIPTAESSVFEAVYGETTFEKIVEADNAGKIVICKYQNFTARLTRILESNLAYFDATAGNQVLQLVVYSTNIWNYSSFNTQHELKTLDNGNVQVTIAGDSAEVATPAYVESLLGTLINGDY